MQQLSVKPSKEPLLLTDPLLIAVREYWNDDIHDLEVATEPVGSLAFFDQLDEYRFDKLRYLPKLVKFNEYSGKTVLEVLPNVENYWIETYGRVALTGKSFCFENYSQDLDRHFKVAAFQPAPRQFACIFIDITERKIAEEELKRYTEFSLTWPSTPDAAQRWADVAVEQLSIIQPLVTIKLDGDKQLR